MSKSVCKYCGGQPGHGLMECIHHLRYLLAQSRRREYELRYAVEKIQRAIDESPAKKPGSMQ